MSAKFLDRLRRAFGMPKRAQPRKGEIASGRASSVVVSQLLKDRVIGNSEREFLDFEERVSLTERILEESTELAHDQISSVARSFEAKLADQLERKKRSVAESLIEEVRSSGVTKDQIYRAIRLSILDPLKDFERSFAALLGWSGVNSEEISKLPEAERWMAHETVSKDAYDELRRQIDGTELKPFSSDFRYESTRCRQNLS